MIVYNNNQIKCLKMWEKSIGTSTLTPNIEHELIYKTTKTKYYQIET